MDTYGTLDGVSIVTLAPEMERSIEVIEELVNRGICVSLGRYIPSVTSPKIGFSVLDNVGQGLRPQEGGSTHPLTI